MNRKTLLHQVIKEFGSLSEQSALEAMRRFAELEIQRIKKLETKQKNKLSKVRQLENNF